MCTYVFLINYTCINNGNVFGGEEAAGIIDYAEGITVTNCINNGNISSNGYVGGIFSYTSSVKGTGLVNNGKISGLEDIGGISAYDEGNSIFSKLYNTVAYFSLITIFIFYTLCDSACTISSINGTVIFAVW